jgi:hypothetical protein
VGPFSRRLFRITGVPAHGRDDDDTQGLVQYHLRISHEIAWVIFRTSGSRFYAESAACTTCSSTAVQFDILYDDELYDLISKRTGIPRERLKQELKAVEAARERLER